MKTSIPIILGAALGVLGLSVLLCGVFAYFGQPSAADLASMDELENKIAAREAKDRAKKNAEAQAAARLAAADEASKVQQQLAAMRPVVELLQGLAERYEIDGNTFRLTVRDPWHSLAQQVRLQNAQLLWKAWAEIRSPNEMDAARLEIVDLRGNAVGGSGLFGSLVSVK